MNCSPPVPLSSLSLLWGVVTPLSRTNALDYPNYRNDVPFLLNLDASRIIYKGNFTTGGGHGDIFKEDVICLIWAAITQGAKPMWLQKNLGSN